MSRSGTVFARHTRLAIGNDEMDFTGVVHRWDMFWADLEPGVGSEQKGHDGP